MGNNKDINDNRDNQDNKEGEQEQQGQLGQQGQHQGQQRKKGQQGYQEQHFNSIQFRTTIALYNKLLEVRIFAFFKHWTFSNMIILDFAFFETLEFQIFAFSNTGFQDFSLFYIP